MPDTVLVVDGGSGERRVRLERYLVGERADAAVAEAHGWIKSLRHAAVDGQPLRRRFTFRGDSLWWFAEIFLHREEVILSLFRTIAALEAFVEEEEPRRLGLVEGSRAARLLAPQVARRHGVRWTGSATWRGLGPSRLARMRWRSRWLHAAALGSRAGRPARAPSARQSDVAIFAHRAFWRATPLGGLGEAYIGPVLDALERKVGPRGLATVGLGPPSNFRARRWWDPLRHGRAWARLAPPVESFAPVSALKASREVWRGRHAARRALWNSRELRERSVLRGYDCWPIVREELAGIALLQWPWSTRAMDEAAAALDVLRPSVVVTYAEAGGWGRALMLECRRRGIPGVGIQHGFIYRHWLNYLHEPDEMQPDPLHPEDRGFPRPDLTLVFDGYAAQHLTEAGHFPPGTIAVTGSPGLDRLVESVGRLTPEDVARARSVAGAGERDALVVVATKYREARSVLPALADAAGSIEGVRLAIKTHPAETPDAYRPVAAGRGHVTVLDASASLAPLLMACRAVVTVNSTVALDAAVLDVPALVIGLPNNLSPFVEAGVLAGAAPGEFDRALRRILYDEEFRQQLARNRRAFLSRYSIGSDGRAAERAADAVLRLARRPAAVP